MIFFIKLDIIDMLYFATKVVNYFGLSKKIARKKMVFFSRYHIFHLSLVSD